MILLAIGIVLMGIGIMMLFDQDGGRLIGTLGGRGPHPSDVGLMVCGIGLVFTILALVQLARDCPRLELNDEGILYSRCLQGVTRIAWSELDRAEIQRGRVAGPIEAVLDSLMVVTTDGRKVVISAPISPAQVPQLREVITRVAARTRSTRPVR